MFAALIDFQLPIKLSSFPGWLSGGNVYEFKVVRKCLSCYRNALKDGNVLKLLGK